MVFLERHLTDVRFLIARVYLLFMICQEYEIDNIVFGRLASKTTFIHMTDETYVLIIILFQIFNCAIGSDSARMVNLKYSKHLLRISGKLNHFFTVGGRFEGTY